jgi:hypothetical protein
MITFVVTPGITVNGVRGSAELDPTDSPELVANRQLPFSRWHFLENEIAFVVVSAFR